MRRFILDLTAGFRGRIAVSSLAGVIRVIAGLVFVALSKRAVDIATGNVTGHLGICLAWLVAVLVFELLCGVVWSRTIEISEAEMKNSLQERLFSRLLTARWTGKDKFHSGDSLSRLTEDCRVVAECLCRTVPTIMTNVLQLTGAFLFLWWFSPYLAITLLVVMPVFIFAGKVFFRKLRELTRQIRDLEGRLQSVMQESLHHRVLLVASRHASRIMDHISRMHKARYRLMRRRSDITLYSKTAVFAGFEVGYMIAFIWGIRGLYTRSVSFGTMTAYLQLAGQIQRPLAELARLLPGVVQSHTAFSRIYEMERIETESERIETEPDREGDIQKENDTPEGLAFHDVTFSYPDSQPILKHFTHTFAAGSKTAVIGESGVGKSTLLLLALALLEPQEGNVEVFRGTGVEREGRMVSSATRSRFVYVPQGNSLLSGSIRENLRLGKPDATEDEMRNALHCAAADFVFDLGSGLDTMCGEHGEGFSEGQAQRIAIARGLLQKGSILLLDEISSSLDEETERVLWERLSSRRIPQTIIFVTHRPAAFEYCDNIVKLCKD